MKHKKCVYTKILQLSKKEPKPLLARMVKLQEECGEFAVAILKKNGWKGMGRDTAATNLDNILEEGCDVMMIVMSVLSEYNFTVSDVEKKMEDKLQKWNKNINNK
jgi:NTP pyrophosphatase (non-canonical NTP hydrolase)